MGRTEFEAWADRIVSGAMVSADVESQKYACANMILHLGPTEDHKPDAFFIHSLRKVAANQVAHQMAQEYLAAAKARTAQVEATEKAKLSVVPSDGAPNAEVLANSSVQST
jgi:hypothetical protein